MTSEQYAALGAWAEITVQAMDMAEKRPKDPFYQDMAARRVRALRQLVKDFHRDNEETK